MTDAEKMIWIMVYAAEWSRQFNRYEETGIERNGVQIIENAWAAVTETKEWDALIKNAFDEDSEQYQMYREVIHGEHSKS